MCIRDRGQAGPGYGQQRQQGAYRGQGGSSPYYQNRQGAPYPGQRPPKKKKKGHRKLFFVLEVLVLVILSLIHIYSSISAYNSIQNGNVKEFVFNSAPDLLFDGLNYYCYSEHPEDGELPVFLGVRYLLAKDDQVPDTYEFVRSFGTISVYQAKEYAGIVSFYNASRAMTCLLYTSLYG